MKAKVSEKRSSNLNELEKMCTEGRKSQLMYATILCHFKRDDWKQFWPTKDILLNIRVIFHVCNEILLLSFMFITRIRSFDVIFC